MPQPAVSLPKPLNDGYKSVTLTENEAKNSMRLTNGSMPLELVFETKRPNEFLISHKYRFRNALANYGWTVQKHEKSKNGRTLVYCNEPNKVYCTRRKR